MFGDEVGGRREGLGAARSQTTREPGTPDQDLLGPLPPLISGAVGCLGFPPFHAHGWVSSQGKVIYGLLHSSKSGGRGRERGRVLARASLALANTPWREESAGPRPSTAPWLVFDGLLLSSPYLKRTDVDI